ncbi:hypothetical protein Tco_1361019 [Tanacetum coccineum]
MKTDPSSCSEWLRLEGKLLLDLQKLHKEPIISHLSLNVTADSATHLIHSSWYSNELGNVSQASWQHVNSRGDSIHDETTGPSATYLEDVTSQRWFVKSISCRCEFRGIHQKTVSFLMLCGTVTPYLWELVPCPDYVMVLVFKWISSHADEYGDVLKNKLGSSKGYRQAEGIDLKNRLHRCTARGQSEYHCQCSNKKYTIIYQMMSKLLSEWHQGRGNTQRMTYDPTIKSFLLANNFFKGAVDPTLFTRKSGRQDSRRSTSGSAQSLGDSWLAGHQRSKEARPSQQHLGNTLQCWDAVLKSLDEILAIKATDLC